MRLKDIYNKEKVSLKKPIISFEIFPPKDSSTENLEKIIKELNGLMCFEPKLISITYGAGGSTRNNSLDLTKIVKKNFDVEVMPHLTCVNATNEFINDYLLELKAIGINNVLALRGDLSDDNSLNVLDFKYANELVKFIKQNTDISLAVAGYPEGHVESKCLDVDLLNLKKKVDEGADVIYTQLFFDNEYYFKYVDKVRELGINIPVIPGILPITNYHQIFKMSELCKVTIPECLLMELHKYKDDNSAIREIGMDFASNQLEKLTNFGVDGVHFYILNKANPTVNLLKNLL